MRTARWVGVLGTVEALGTKVLGTVEGQGPRRAAWKRPSTHATARAMRLGVTLRIPQESRTRHGNASRARATLNGRGAPSQADRGLGRSLLGGDGPELPPHGRKTRQSRPVPLKG